MLTRLWNGVSVTTYRLDKDAKRWRRGQNMFHRTEFLWLAPFEIRECFSRRYFAVILAIKVYLRKYVFARTVHKERYKKGERDYFFQQITSSHVSWWDETRVHFSWKKKKYISTKNTARNETRSTSASPSAIPSGWSSQWFDRISYALIQILILWGSTKPIWSSRVDEVLPGFAISVKKLDAE